MDESIYTIGMYRDVGYGSNFLCEEGELLTYKEAEERCIARNKTVGIDSSNGGFKTDEGQTFYMFAEIDHHGDI